MKIDKRSLICALLIFPRTLISYAIYVVGFLLLIDYNDKESFTRLKVILFLIITFYILNSIFFDTSLTAMLIQTFLTIPFILYLSGFKTYLSFFDIRNIIRKINIAILFFSCLSMASKGFPLKLPYIDFAPDYYNGLYGLGGAKIVTIIGYFGILIELNENEIKSKPHYILVALINFITPSYLLGFLAGLVSLLIIVKNKKIILSSLIIFIFFILEFIIYRYNSLGFISFYDIPKIKAIEIIYETYKKYPHTIIFGTGLGQFSSTAAFWANDFIASLSTHSIPKLPLFYSSEIHNNMYYPVFSKINSFWDISSSSQKPYSSINSLFTEFGLINTILITIIITKRVFNSAKNKFKSISIVSFILLIFFLDMSHDNIFMFCFLFMYTEYLRKKNEYNLHTRTS